MRHSKAIEIARGQPEDTLDFEGNINKFNHKDMSPMTKTHCVSPDEGLFPSGYLEGGLFLCHFAFHIYTGICLFVMWSHYVALVSLELLESYLPLPLECRA